MSGRKSPHVIKASAAIHISNTVTLLQRRAWNVLLHNCYNNLLQQETHQIRVDDLCRQLSYTSSNREHLKSLLRELNKHQVEWNILGKDHNYSWGVATLISGAEIINGVCYYSFNERLREKLYQPDMYARINLITQNLFKSKYSLALYELCIDYFDAKRQVGETSWMSIEEFKQFMGLESEEYPKYKYLATRVIRGPIKEINSISNITVEVKTEARGPGRNITHIKFLVTPNKENQKIPVPKRNSKTGNQMFLPDPLIELDNIALYKKMMKDFGISSKKAQEILESTDELIIEKSLDYVWKKVKEGKITSSVAGYTISVINNGGKQLVEQASLSEKQKSLIAEEQKRDQLQKHKESLKEQFHEDLSKKVWDMFKSLPPKIKKNFEKQFVKEILESDPLMKHMLIQYKDSGFKHVALKQMMLSFLKPNLLDDEEQNFELYYQQLDQKKEDGSAGTA